MFFFKTTIQDYHLEFCWFSVYFNLEHVLFFTVFLDIGIFEEK